MGLRINTNIDAMVAYRNLSVTNSQMSKSLERLSSGLRSNRAADDAAGLSISEGLKAQVSGLQQAVSNAQDGISVVQTAEGALTEVHSILQRMRELALQASNEGAMDVNARNAAGLEVNQLSQAFTAGGLAAAFGTKVFTASGSAAAALATIDAAIQTVSDNRASLGAVQNRFEHTIANLNVAVENLSASRSRITDTAMAKEMVNITRSQILQQAGTAMLAQADQALQSVLKQ